MENRGLKTRTAISTSIDKKLYERIKAYSKETSVPISKLFDKALTMYFESVKPTSLP